MQVHNMSCTKIAYLFCHSKQYLYTTCCELVFFEKFNEQSLVSGLTEKFNLVRNANLNQTGLHNIKYVSFLPSTENFKTNITLLSSKTVSASFLSYYVSNCQSRQGK